MISFTMYLNYYSTVCRDRLYLYIEQEENKLEYYLLFLTCKSFWQEKKNTNAVFEAVRNRLRGGTHFDSREKLLQEPGCLKDKRSTFQVPLKTALGNTKGHKCRTGSQFMSNEFFSGLAEFFVAGNLQM